MGSNKNSEAAVLFLLCFTWAKAIPIEPNPVIFIPGDGGSQLEAKLNKSSTVHYICDKTTPDFFSIWLNIELLVPVVIDCWIDNVKLSYNNVTRTTSNQEGVDIRVPNFGDPFTVEWIDPSKIAPGAYFKDIGNLLVQMGYTRNINLRGAPFDFRKGPNENDAFFFQLQALVEETYKRNGNTKVILLAHSMGGPMSLYFLQNMPQEWKDKYIKSLVTLSAAWGGSIKAIKVFVVGDDLGVFVLNGGILKQMQITSPSLAWLMPSQDLWQPNEVLVQTDYKNYSLSNIQQFFNDIGYPVGWEMRKDQEPYMDLSPPGVEVHCLYGTGVDTIDKMIYKSGKFPDSPTFQYGDGDGTVNLRSLQVCNLWKEKQLQSIYDVPLHKVDHMQILNDPKVLDYIKNLIK